jgi:hypothetical protein
MYPQGKKQQDAVEHRDVEQQRVKSSAPKEHPSPRRRTTDKQHSSSGVARRRVVDGETSPRRNKASTLIRTEPTISPTETTWSEAHRRTCLERKSLVASFEQVTEAFSSFGQLPEKREDVVVWTEGASLEAAIAVQRKLTATLGVASITKQVSNPERPSSWAKRLWSGAAKGASSLILGADDYDSSIPELGADDGDTKIDSTGAFIVDSNQLIVNLDLTEACLRELVQTLRDKPTRVLLRKSSESNIQANVAEWFSFETWCRQVAIECKNKDTQAILANLDTSMCDFLGDLLVANKMATFAPNREDRIILGNTSELSSTEVDTMVTLFDLQIHEQSMNKNVEAWSKRADDCGRSALEAKRNGRLRQAAMDVKRRQMLLHQVATTQNSLLQLEQIRNTLEHAQTQSQVMECLQSTAETLKTIRTDPTALQSLHLEIDNTRTAIEQAHAANYPSLVESRDEDQKLLLELEDMGLLNDDVDDEKLLLELNELEVSPVATKRNTAKLVGVTTGMSTPPTAFKTSNTLVDATIGVASAKHVTKAQTSPTGLGGSRKPRKKDSDDSDADIRDLERRLEALRAPAPSNSKKNSSDKKAPDKTSAAVAF